MAFREAPEDKRAWFYAHMTRFLAAYIATVTALGTVGITIWRVSYVRKFARQQNAS